MSKSIELQSITDFRHILKTCVVAVFLRKHPANSSHCTSWNDTPITFPQLTMRPCRKGLIGNVSVFSEEIKEKKS